MISHRGGMAAAPRDGWRTIAVPSPSSQHCDHLDLEWGRRWLLRAGDGVVEPRGKLGTDGKELVSGSEFGKVHLL